MSRSQQLKRASRRWKFAGSMAFIIGAFLVYQKVYYESRDFYAENFEAFTVSEGLIKHCSEHETKALQLYAAGDYSQALNDFNKDNELINPELFIYRGICKMEIGNYWEAITDFQQHKELNPEMTQQAEWYKILSLLALERKEEVIEMLSYYLEQSNFNFNKEKAIKLLKEY